MCDREKVIKGLECCKGECLEPSDEKCPYYPETHGDRCFHVLLSDALALLKAQEMVRPVRKSAHGHGADEVWFVCGGCGGFLGAEGIEGGVKKVCPRCGKAVKWDD